MPKKGTRSNLIGNTYGRLYVDSIASEEYNQNGNFYQYRYLCLCSCGNTKIIPAFSLKSGIKSCGCLKSEITAQRNYKHGLSKSDIWIKYSHMKARCLNPHESNYYRYGGRGITVCKEWLDKNGFENFVKWSEDHGYKEGLSLDRIDNDGNYEPSNCRWVPFRYQSFNRSTTRYQNNESIAQKAYECGVSVKTVYRRIKLGWEEDRWFIPSTRKIKEV